MRRVSRRDRRSAPALAGLRWICDECIGDIAAFTGGSRIREHVAHALTGRRATDRSVA